MEEETEENMRIRFLAIEKRVAELSLCTYNKNEIYKLEAEINEIHSKLLSISFYLKEAKEVLEEAQNLQQAAKRHLQGGLFFCTIIIALLFIQTW